MRRLIAAALLVPAAAAAAYNPEPGSFAYNRALFDFYSQQYFDALVTAQSNAEVFNADAGITAQDNTRFLAEAMLSYGMYRESLGLFRGLLKDGDLSDRERAEIWLRIARYEYERGYFDDAQTTLAEMQADVGGDLNEERQTLQGLILLRRDDPDAAIEALTRNRLSNKDNFAKYNQAMAYIAAGDARTGRRKLDDIGRETVKDPVEHALRDRANLALAYNYLAEADGDLAKPVLQRIRLNGPYSDEALLGLGWAEIASEKAEQIRFRDEETSDTIGGVLGVILKPGKVDNPLRNRLGLQSAEQEAETLAERYRRALLPWLELDGRDPKKPAVLEVQLAIPYALMELKDNERARIYYERAIDRLEAGRVAIDKAIDGIRSGRMTETMIRRDRDVQAGWDWRLRDLPDAPETYYLAEVLATNIFQEALKNYRDLRQLQRRTAFELARLDNARNTGLMAVDADQLFANVRRNQDEPLFKNVTVDLKLARGLGEYPRNATLEGLLAWTYRYASPRRLRIAANVPAFGTGSLASVVDLKPDMNALLEDINGTLQAQTELMNKIAVGSLEKQKAQLTRYLIDARFALARIYDARSTQEDAP